MSDYPSLKVKQSKLKNPELSYFCSQIALVMHSGISALEGITMMMDDNPDKKDVAILSNLVTSIERQGFLWRALEDVGVFPAYMINMVRIGEETGTLDDVMEALTHHYDREESIKRTISHAVTYPLIMAGMIMIVIVVLLVRVMPIFSQVFAQLGTEMTGLAAGLARIGEVIGNYAIYFVIGFIILVALIFVLTHTKLGRNLGRIFKGIRTISLRINAGRFADGMAITLKSGLDPDRSFMLVSSLTEDDKFKSLLNICKKHMEEGEGLMEALQASGIFSGIYSRMITIGSKAGAMDSVMHRISDMYQEEVDSRINNILAIIEPALIVALSLIVGVILMSVMFPLLGVMSSL